MSGGDPTTAPADPVRLTRLGLADFRNYATLTLPLEGRLVAITGPNGAGKTNLLEAVSLLAPGRGMRRAAYAEMTRKGSTGGWAVSADLTHDGADTRIGTGTHGLAETGGRSRQVRINGANASAESMQEHLRILWLTPAMDRLFTGPPGDRRRFLDRLVMALDPAHGRRMTGFDKLLTSRNRLLDEGRSADWLDAVETELATSAVAVSVARRETVERLKARIAGESDESGFPAAGVALEGDFEAEYASGLFTEPAAEAALRYRDALREARVRDRAAGRALFGPHRSDLAVTFAAKGMPAAVSSTGEQKALLVGLVLAHAGLVAEASGIEPVLLLDEIAAHLDAGRRAALFARLEARGGQSLMTGTDASLFSAIGDACQRLSVDAGKVI